MLSFALAAWADVELLQPEYDFGVMKEAAGPQTGRSYVVNKGTNPVVISQVRPSCGCTGADYQDGPIAPGDTAWITYTYDPAGRPGRFEKTVRVIMKSSDDSTQTKLIRIKGTVLGKPESLAKYYPIELGSVRLTEQKILFGNLRMGGARHFFVKAYNQSTDTIYPKATCPDKAMDVTALPEAVGPGDIATVSLYLNTRYIQKPGPVNYQITFTPDTVHPENTYLLEVNADITPAK